MNLYQKVNRYLDQLQFSNKAKLLIGIIASGMLTIGFLMLISIFALKYDYETLFQKRTVALVGLQEIKDLYSVNIYNTFFDIKEENINIRDAADVIVLAQQIIKTQWQNYQKASQYEVGGLPEFASNWLKFFLLREKVALNSVHHERLLKKIEQKMNTINIAVLNTINTLYKGELKKAYEQIDGIALQINAINIYLSTLISTNLKEAINEKESNNKIFNTSIIMLFLLIGFVFFLSIFISLIITNHFKSLNDSLESKVDEKTKELQILNDSLEKRVKTEVENNRKKDQIMFQQARLASLGEMLQNIAHQWRQPLGALTMIIQSFQSKFLSGKLDEEFIESRVEDAGVLAKNMSETLEDFRTFFDPNKTHNRFNVKTVIEKSIDLTKYQLGKEGITLEFFMEEDIIIYGFENELTHVILNLINNSKDALLEKEIENKHILIIVKKTAVNVLINVIDNAGGIQNDIMPKVFDPYFTTKHKSVGTGIGLYMSKQMVEKHMFGKIWCKNIKHKMHSKKLQDCAMFTIEIPKNLDNLEDKVEKEENE